MDFPDFPNWFANVSSYFKKLPDEPLRVLQIGVYTGDATKWLLENQTIEKIHDVDTWKGSNESDYEKIDFDLVEKYYDFRFNDPRITKFKMTSDEFFVQNKDFFNFIYIDGQHTASQTAIDGLHGFEVLEKDGIMAFDDYGWSLQNDAFLEPKRGIDAFLAICEGRYNILEKSYQVWIQKL